MTTTTAPDHTCYGARFTGTPAARATVECPACPDPTLRATSAYTLRVAQDPAGADLLLDILRGAAEDTGAVVTDTHAATQGGTPYVSLSFRIPTSDTDAVDLALHLLYAVRAEDREVDLHTGLGVHCRVIDLPLPTHDAELAAEVEAGRACGYHDRPVPCAECA